MKKAIYSLTISLIVIFISGCSKTSTPTQSNIDIEDCIISEAKAPKWVCSAGNIDDYYTDVAEAKSTNLGIGFQRNEAMAKARASLSRQLSTEVKAKVENFERSTGTTDDEGVERVVAQVSKSVAKNTIEGSKQLSFWQHPETNSVWVLVGLSKEHFRNGVKSSFGDRQKQWQQFEASKALEALDKEFEDKQKQREKEFKEGQGQNQ